MYIHIKGKAETIVGPEMQNVRALLPEQLIQIDIGTESPAALGFTVNNLISIHVHIYLNK